MDLSWWTLPCVSSYIYSQMYDIALSFLKDITHVHGIHIVSWVLSRVKAICPSPGQFFYEQRWFENGPDILKDW
jgi:hypothetical protein